MTPGAESRRAAPDRGEERPLLDEARHGHVKRLSVFESTLADRPLRRVGVCLHGARVCHAGTARRRSAAASAPTKLGMRPSAPGNRATLALRSASQTSSRSCAFAVSNVASPPASAS